MAKTLEQKRPTHDEIARRAYAIFEEQGRPQGCEMDHWLQAEAQLNAAPQNPTSASSPTNRAEARPAARPRNGRS